MTTGRRKGRNTGPVVFAVVSHACTDVMKGTLPTMRVLQVQDTSWLCRAGQIVSLGMSAQPSPPPHLSSLSSGFHHPLHDV